MSTKRIKSPASDIWPDDVIIETPEGADDLAAAFSLLVANSPKNRIETLRDTPKLHDKVRELSKWLDDLNGKANPNLLLAINVAEAQRVRAKAEADVVEGRKVTRQRRSAGFSSGKERASERKQDWDAWQKMASELFAKNPALSVNAAAIRIAKVYGGSSEAIRKRIKK